MSRTHAVRPRRTGRGAASVLVAATLLARRGGLQQLGPHRSPAARVGSRHHGRERGERHHVGRRERDGRHGRRSRVLRGPRDRPGHRGPRRRRGQRPRHHVVRRHVIRTHWFPRGRRPPTASPAPTVLMGPGWGLPGDTNVEAVGRPRRAQHRVAARRRLQRADLGPARLRRVDRDGRGRHAPTTRAATCSSSSTGWPTQPEVAARRRPATRASAWSAGPTAAASSSSPAAIDCRVDALVPVIAWHSLGTSLYKADTVKAGWADRSCRGSAPRRRSTRTSPRPTQSGDATGVLSADDGPGSSTAGPASSWATSPSPTLIVQGTVDTLFTLDEDVTNYRILRDNGVPIAMLWFCGGHGVCLTDPGDADRCRRPIIAWLDRYVKGDESVDTGARFDFLDQNGVQLRRRRLPAGGGRADHRRRGPGTLELTAEGGAGPTAVPDRRRRRCWAAWSAPITPAKATNAVDVTIDPAPRDDARWSARPELTLTYSGTVPAGDAPDPGVRPAGRRRHRPRARQPDHADPGHARRRDPRADHPARGRRLRGRRPGSSLTLQLVATTTAYGQPRLGGSVTFAEIGVSLPVATGYSPA